MPRQKNEGTMRSGQEFLLLAIRTSRISAVQKRNRESVGAALLLLACAVLGTRLWMEYIEAAPNWANGPSRQLEQCDWLHTNQFHTKVVDIPSWLWAVPQERWFDEVVRRVRGN